MSYERAIRNGHVAGLVALIAQLLAVVLKASGATAVSWTVILLPTLAGVGYLSVSLGTYYLVTARDRLRRRVWRRFDYDNKQATRPPVAGLVWIVEDFYEEGVTLGYYDGVTMRTWTGADDCKVSWWAPITYPEPPQRWRRERDQVLAELDEGDSRA